MSDQPSEASKSSRVARLWVFDTVASAWFGIVSGVALLAVGFWLIGYYTSPGEGPHVVPNDGGPDGELLDTIGGVVLVYGLVRMIQGAVALWNGRYRRMPPRHMRP